jgi:hypothetical protein
MTPAMRASRLHGCVSGSSSRIPAALNPSLASSQAALDSNGSIDYSTALALASTNIEKALGVKSLTRDADELVVFQSGDMFDFESKVIGIISARKTAVEFF